MKPTRRLAGGVEGILEELRALCLSLPETSEKASFGHPNFLAGNKTFVTFEMIARRPSIAFRLGSVQEVESRAADATKFFATPYGRGLWVSLWVDGEFDWQVVRALAVQSYRTVALRRMLAALDADHRSSPA